MKHCLKSTLTISLELNLSQVMQKLVVIDDPMKLGERVDLKENEVHLWLLSKNDINDVSRFYESLPSYERDRAREFKREEDADRFILRHGLLRALLQIYLPIHHIEFSSTSKHKLYLKNVPLQFNCSSSENYFAFAFSKERRLGVDVEVIRPLLFVDEMIEACFSIEEQAYLSRGDKLRKFFEVWTNKEAVFKALGLGITHDLTKVVCVSEKDETWSPIDNNFLNKPIWLCSLKRWEQVSLSLALL